MNRKQLIAYVEACTNKLLVAEQISTYIAWGVLEPDTSQPGAAHHYDIAQVLRLVRYIKALSPADAANEMSARVGWHIPSSVIRGMCKTDEIIHLKTPNDYKIPADSLGLLENKLRLQHEQRIDPQYAELAIKHCLELMTMTDLVVRCNDAGHIVSLSMMSRIYSGKRRMKNKLYNFLLTVPKKEL